ncbi:uncharacterized protein LOC131246804 isoform X2 [Magnolia sinica]|uniref:uncharacterized protein LOC131246804 isoform X2 n=1 Tax=Magnolia sinica TaxID=86752 RepID=UPI00265AA103|nr:uncharacterized protein LOC131246804 isoform X2 [Magnolia sinica]
MEAESLRSNKRKRPSSSSSSQQMQGTFTRRRSELFLHRNRSGRARPDPSLRRKLIIQRLGSSNEDPVNWLHPDEIPDITSHISIKDLRARRVFSPTTIVGDCSPHKKGKILADPDDDMRPMSSDVSRIIEFGAGGGVSGRVDALDEERLQTTPPDSDIFCKSQHHILVEPDLIGPDHVAENQPVLRVFSENPSIGEGFCHGKIDENIQIDIRLGSSSDQNDKIRADQDDDMNSMLSDVSRDVEFDGGSGVSSGIDGLGEEWLQTTPPDSDIFRKSQPRDYGGIVVEPDLIDPDNVVENLPGVRVSGENPSVAEVFCHAKMGENIPVKNRSGGLGRHSRLKLFRNTNSFSYRRMLPFLMDLAKDNASALEIHSCGSPWPVNVEKTVEERPLPPPLNSLSNETDSDRCKSNPSSMQCCYGGLGTSPTEKSKEKSPTAGSPVPCVIECLNLDSSPQPITEIPIQNHHDNPAASYDTAASIRTDQYSEMAPQHDQVVSESCKLEPSCDSVGSIHEMEIPDISLSNPPISHDMDTGLSGRERNVELDGNSRILDGVDGSSEECIQATPSGGNILCKSSGLVDGGNVGMLDLIGQDPISKNLSCARFSNDNPSNVERFRRSKDANALVKNKLGLIPCSQLKLFQTPNSLSYRRLLPFLMDLAKDNASALEIHSSQKFYPVEVEKAVEERPPPLLLDSLSHDSDLSSRKTDPLPVQQCFDGSGASQTEKTVSLAAGSSGSCVSECLHLYSSEQLTTETAIQNPPEKPASLAAGSSGSFESECLHVYSSEQPTTETPIQNPHEKPSSLASGSSGSSMSECLHLYSSEQPTAKTPIQNPPENPALSHDLVISMLPDSSIETASENDWVMLRSSFEFEPGHDALISVHRTEPPCNELSSSPIEQEALLIEECDSHIQDPSGLCRESEKDNQAIIPTLTIDVKPLEILGVLPQHPSQANVSVPSERPVLAPMKGILKKCPRACRGLCTCQNCTSFRLHAEKANEFSRKQMQDAKEVAVNLMKELSCLRSLMEKSFLPMTDSANGHIVGQINQVKGFCKRASRAEEIARSRLRQMTRDLKVHCRITSLQQRRVSFADHVEERLIPKSEVEDDE